MKIARYFPLFFSLLAMGLRAQPLPDLGVVVSACKNSYGPGDTVRLGVMVKIPANFHLYGNPMGPGIGRPLRLAISGPPEVRWIAAHKIKARQYQPPEGDWVWAYTGEAAFFFTGVLSGAAEGALDGAIAINALICHTACIPIDKRIMFTLAVRGTSGQPLFADDAHLAKLFAESEPIAFDTTIPREGAGLFGAGPAGMGKAGPAQDTSFGRDYEPVESRVALGFWAALFFAFIAGIILNVMPCVLPVLGIKILSFSQGAGVSRRTAVVRALIFSAGMMSIFMVLASFAAFAQYSWGEQFQNPKVLIGIIAVIFVFALGMFDIYTILLPSMVGDLERKTGEGFWGNFTRGMFATLLATPCSGPFLGATLAWTLTQPPLVIYCVFFATGAGMAFPYVLFSSSRRLMRHLPRPGRWMDDFKRLMGLLLFGFAAFLMAGLPSELIVPTVGLCITLALAVLTATRFAPYGSSLRRSIIVGAVALLIVAAGLFVNFRTVFFGGWIAQHSENSGDEVAWLDFTPQRLIEAHARGQHVVVDFTANWCLNCQYNKVAVLDAKPVAALMHKKGVLALMADLTDKNIPAESLLRHLGSRSIPFLAVFPGNDPYRPIIMRDVLDKARVNRVLESLADKSAD